MSKEMHCCVRDKCTGGKYGEVSMNCMFCKNVVFLQCMRNRDELITKDLMIAFDIGAYEEDGTFIIKIVDFDKVARFNKIFNVDSPFAITCDVRASKHKNASIKKRNEEDDPLNRRLTNLDDESEDANDDVIPTHLKKPSDKKSVYSVHISRFEMGTKSDQIIQRIMSKTSLNINVFSVEELTNQKRTRNFVNFKISTVNKDVFDEIMNEKLWSPEFVAREYREFRDLPVKRHNRYMNKRKPYNRKWIPNNNGQENNQRRSFRSNFGQRNQFQHNNRHTNNFQHNRNRPRPRQNNRNNFLQHPNSQWSNGNRVNSHTNHFQSHRKYIQPQIQKFNQFLSPNLNNFQLPHFTVTPSMQMNQFQPQFQPMQYRTYQPQMPIYQQQMPIYQ